MDRLMTGRNINKNNEGSSKKNKFIAGIVFLVFLYFAFIIFFDSGEKVTIENQREGKEESVHASSVAADVKYEVSEGDIPADIFSEYGKFDANDTEKIIAAAENVYDLSNLKIGRELRFYFNGESKAKKMEYDRDTERMIIVERKREEFSVREEKIAYEVSQEIACGKINNFFYVDAQEAGLSEATVLEVGDIFSFDIDFTTEIQVDDEFSVIYEKRMRDGKQAPDGVILATKFINEGVAYYAYYFEN
ncbi:MAG TPA: hypothetical protein ENG89_02330, partial [Candidatus Moranbacteria bacterium]|nr:hypothetical protein [Candidatus Moranbacteria bacterium]